MVKKMENQQKMAFSGGHSAKIMVGLMIMLMLFSCVSALEFDNVKLYDEETRTVEIKNSVLGIDWFSYGQVMKVELLSELHRTIVSGGDEGYALEWKVTNYEKDYKNFITSMESYDFKNLDIEKEGSYSYKIYDPNAEYTIPVYEMIPNGQKGANGTIVLENTYVRDETKKGMWIDFNPSDPLPIGEYLIRAYWMGDLKAGERIEVIPTLAGVRVEEWLDFGVADTIEWSFGEDGTAYNIGLGMSFTLGTVGVDGDYIMKGFAFNFDTSTSTDDCVYEVQSTSGGNPNGILTTSSSTCTPIKVDGWANISVADVALSAGTTYFIGITGAGGTVRINRDLEGSYAGGHGFYGGTGSWADDSGSEYMFMVYAIPSSTAPEINITYPLNTTYTSQIPAMNYTVDANGQNCWYSLNDNINSSTVSAGTNFTGLSADAGSNTWITYCNSSDGDIGVDSQTFYLNLIPPNISIVTPANTSYNTDQTGITYTVSSDATTCWYSTDAGSTNTSVICGNNVTGLSSGEGSSTWMVAGNTTLGGLNQSYVTFHVDTTDPVIYYNPVIEDVLSLSETYNVSINYTASDTNLQACWYYNGTGNTSLADCGTNGTVQVTEGSYTFIIYANDSVNNIGYNETTFNYRQVKTSTYESTDPVVDGDTVTYGLWVNITNTPDVNAVFKWNNIEYTPTETNYTHYTYFQRSIVIPEGTGNATGKLILWNWSYDVTGITGTQYTTLDNTTVFNLSADDCSVYPIEILNLSLKDEEGNSYVNASAGSNVEVDVYLYSTVNSSISYHFFDQYTNDENPVVCIPDGILNVTNLTIEFTIGFDSTDHVNEFFYLDNGTLQNDVETFNSLTSRHINLFDLLTTDSTSFLFNYFDLDGLAVDDAMIHVFRKYIGAGVFREVERAKSDTNGDTIVHLVEEDVIYYFVISQEGNILFTSSTYTALCQTTPCIIALEESGGFTEFENDWDLIDNGGYTLTSSSLTREVNLTYALTTPSEMNLTVYRLDSDGEYEAVGSDALTSTTGSLVVTLPVISGNTTFFASVYQDDDFKKSQWIDFEEDAGLYLGNTLSLFLGALIILALGLMAVSEGSGVIIFLIFGMFLSMALGLVDYRTSTTGNVLIYFIIAGALIIWKLTRRNR